MSQNKCVHHCQPLASTVLCGVIIKQVIATPTLSRACEGEPSNILTGPDFLFDETVKSGQNMRS